MVCLGKSRFEKSILPVGNKCISEYIFLKHYIENQYIIFCIPLNKGKIRATIISLAGSYDSLLIFL